MGDRNEKRYGADQRGYGNSRQTKKGSGQGNNSSKNGTQSRSQSSSKNGTQSRSQSGSKSSTGARSGNQNKRSGKPAYSEELEKKRNSSYERQLHSSESAKKIKHDRKIKKYNRNRRLYNFMFYAAIFVAVTAVVVIMSVTVLFGIDNIIVEMDDDTPYTETQVVSSCDIRTGQNLFSAPISEAAEQIMSALPYIETCVVERRLPSTVKITVTSAKPVGIVTDTSGQQVIVSSGLRIIEQVVSSGNAAGIPVINGVTIEKAEAGSVIVSENAAYVDVAIEIVRTLDTYDLQLDSITFSSGGNITAMYDERINIVIGTASDLRNKLELAAVLINEGKITKHERGRLDLSIEGRATFTPDYVMKQYGDGSSSDDTTSDSHDSSPML